MFKLVVSFLLVIFPAITLAGGVISHIANKLPVTMTVEEARNLLMLAHKTTTTGEALQLFLLPKNNVHLRDFLVNVLGISAASYFDIIDSYASTGKIKPPLFMDSEARIFIAVSVTSGGIGIVTNPLLSERFSTVRPIQIK